VNHVGFRISQSMLCLLEGWHEVESRAIVATVGAKGDCALVFDLDNEESGQHQAVWKWGIPRKVSHEEVRAASSDEVIRWVNSNMQQSPFTFSITK
jgi:hypothetical protein